MDKTLLPAQDPWETYKHGPVWLTLGNLVQEEGKWGRARWFRREAHRPRPASTARCQCQETTKYPGKHIHSSIVPFALLHSTFCIIHLSSIGKQGITARTLEFILFTEDMPMLFLGNCCASETFNRKFRNEALADRCRDVKMTSRHQQIQAGYNQVWPGQALQHTWDPQVVPRHCGVGGVECEHTGRQYQTVSNKMTY